MVNVSAHRSWCSAVLYTKIETLKKIVCILAKRVKNLPKVIDQFPFDPK